MSLPCSKSWDAVYFSGIVGPRGTPSALPSLTISPTYNSPHSRCSRHTGCASLLSSNSYLAQAVSSTWNVLPDTLMMDQLPNFLCLSVAFSIKPTPTILFNSVNYFQTPAYPLPLAWIYCFFPERSPPSNTGWFKDNWTLWKLCYSVTDYIWTNLCQNNF